MERGDDAGDVFPAETPLHDAPPLLKGATRVDVARRFRSAPQRTWGAREDRLLPRALTVFGGCAARAAQALGVSGADVRRRAAALALACSSSEEGKWCCRRCAPHDLSLIHI